MKKKTTRWLKIWSIDGRECRDFSDESIVRATGYSLMNVRRWADGAPIPEPARKLLALVMLGCLPEKAWERWRIRGNVLHNTDTGDSYDIHDLSWAPWIALQFSDYRRRIRELEATNADLARQLVQAARMRHRCLSSWHQRQPVRPRQADLFDFPQAQKSPA